jgi:hypothetical protein
MVVLKVLDKIDFTNPSTCRPLAPLPASEHPAWAHSPPTRNPAKHGRNLLFGPHDGFLRPLGPMSATPHPICREVMFPTNTGEFQYSRPN